MDNKKVLIAASIVVGLLGAGLLAYALTVGDVPLAPGAAPAPAALPAWLPWVAGCVPVVALLAVVGALLMHRHGFLKVATAQDFVFQQSARPAWRSIRTARGEPPLSCEPSIGAVLDHWNGLQLARGHALFVRVVDVTNGREPALARAGTRGRRANATIIPEAMYEWRWAWLTRLLRGAGPVWQVVLRHDSREPHWAGALLAHELGAHLFPAMCGRGWNYDPLTGEDGNDPAAAVLTRALLDAVSAEVSA